jgi:hypothetical protein
VSLSAADGDKKARSLHRGIRVEPSLFAEIEYRAKFAEGKDASVLQMSPRGFMSKTV